MNLNFFTPDPNRRMARMCMWILAVGMLLVSIAYLVWGFNGAKEYGLQSGWGYRLQNIRDMNHSLSDGEPVWQGNAYVLKGINPFDVMNGRADYDSEIGPIVPGTTNVPWTYILSNLWLPGFLPFDTSAIISLVWWVLLWSMATVMLWRKMKQLGVNDPLFLILLVLTMFCQCSIAIGLETLNPAMLAIPTLFIACLLDDKKYPYLVGLCLALAMIKPQLGALFFIPFIVKGNYKAVLTGVGVVCLALLMVSMQLGENPITLTIGSFSDGFNALTSTSLSGAPEQIPTSSGIGRVYAAGAEYVPVSQGIFMALFPNVFPLDSATLLHWLVFIPYTFLLCWWFRKAPFYILFSIPFVISMLWMYNLPVNRSAATLWMALMIFLYTWAKQKRINNGKTLVAYASMVFMGVPFMTVFMAKMLGTFMIWPITALALFVILHIVLWWYWNSEKEKQHANTK